MCASILARTLVDSHNAFPHQNHEVKGVFETCRVFLKGLQRYSRSTATGRLVSGATLFFSGFLLRLVVFHCVPPVSPS